jgi:hypothetical protein
MKIKTEDIKKIVEEVVRDALSEQEEQMVDPDQVVPSTAAPETAQPAVKQKADVDVVLKYIQKINNVVEYAQLLNAVLKHVPGGDKPKHKKAVKQVFAAFGVSSSAVKKVAGE